MRESELEREHHQKLVKEYGRLQQRYTTHAQQSKNICNVTLNRLSSRLNDMFCFKI